MKNYELLTILKPNLDSEEVDKVVEKLHAEIAEMGGKVLSSDKIGRKKLAFDVQNFRDGFFVTTILTVSADKVAELNRSLRLNENVIRIMFLEAPKKATV